MATFTTQATRLAFVKTTTSSSWSNVGAMQGSYIAQGPRVGAMQFGTLLDIDWTNQIISAVRLTMSFVGAGANRVKTIGLYRGAKSSIDGTGASMLGASLGQVSTGGTAYNAVRTVTLPAAVLANFSDFLQSMASNVLMLYMDERGTSTNYTDNYLQIAAATLDIDYEPAGSDGELDRSHVDAGERIALTISPFDTTGTLTHTVEWTLGTASSGTQALGAGVMQTTYTIPLSWLTQLPNATQGIAQCTLSTYVNGTLRAARSLEFIVTVPMSLVPVFSASTTPVGTTGSYWQHIGGARLQIDNIQTQYGATVTRYSITGAEGVSGAQAQLTTPNFVESGVHVYTLAVTDSRGRTTSQTLSIDVQPLAAPVISSFSVERYATVVGDDAELDYVAAYDGDHVWCNIVANIDGARGNNAATAYMLYNAVGDSVHKRVELAWTGTSYEVVEDRELLRDSFALSEAWEFELHVEDGHTAVTSYARVEKGWATMHWAGSGYGVGVGMYSDGTQDAPKIQCAWPVHFYGGVSGINELRESGEEFYWRTADNGATPVYSFPAIETAGLYLYVVNVSFSSNGTGSRRIELQRNGTWIASTTQRAASIIHRQDCMAIAAFEAGDVPGILVQQNSGEALDVYLRCWLVRLK